MKILYQSRVDLYSPRGGDTLQMENTKAAIEKLDPSIKIDIRPEIKPADIKNYDIVHIFNLDWVCETYLQAKWAKANNIPIALSAIHHSEDEVKRFEAEARFDIRRIYNFFIPWQSARDFGKNVYRSFFNFRKAYPTIIQFFRGIRNEQRETIQMSDIILVQTDEEAKDIKTDFKVDGFKWKKVVNGVNVELFDNASQEAFNRVFKDFVNEDISESKILLNVGRIEPRKNQLNLAKAFLKLKSENKLEGYKLVFIGGMTQRSLEYSWRFKLLIESHVDIYYIPSQPPEVIASAMAHNGVYVHPSWFETTGLVTLEASLAGMPVVAAGERVHEYLGDNAYYCDPGNVSSISNAILKAVVAPAMPEQFKKEVSRRYNWSETARQTIEVYREILSRR